MRVLVACEESQTVCKAFRERGHEAYSCDIVSCTGGHEEWHIKGDAVETMKLLGGGVVTMDNVFHPMDNFDLMIAHPPCTYLTVTGNRWYDTGVYGDFAKERYKERYKAIVFFMQFALSKIEKVAIENPVGIMSTAWKKPSQIIEPWMFGHPTVKKTCLWLKNLPPLVPTDVCMVDPDDVYEYVAKNGHIKRDSRNRSRCRHEDRSTYRSKTFDGIARAMAEQWGGDVH